MFIKPIRLGRDAELRQTQQGKPMLCFAGAYDVGFGNNKTTQWIDCVMFGERGNALAQYLKKGTQLVIYGDDLKLEQFQKNDGTQGAKISCIVNKVDLIGSREASSSHPQAPQQNNQQGGYNNQQNQTYSQAPQQAPDIIDFNDDVPF